MPDGITFISQFLILYFNLYKLFHHIHLVNHLIHYIL